MKGQQQQGGDGLVMRNVKRVLSAAVRVLSPVAARREDDFSFLCVQTPPGGG